VGRAIDASVNSSVEASRGNNSTIVSPTLPVTSTGLSWLKLFENRDVLNEDLQSTGKLKKDIT